MKRAKGKRKEKRQTLKFVWGQNLFCALFGRIDSGGVQVGGSRLNLNVLNTKKKP